MTRGFSLVHRYLRFALGMVFFAGGIGSLLSREWVIGPILVAFGLFLVLTTIKWEWWTRWDWPPPPPEDGADGPE
jgi:hypothetical protein